jgi:hypothetical protein
VQVHYNSVKPAALGVLAYTRGTEIHVGPGQEKSLPHEAWHVVQQKQGRVKPTTRTYGVPLNDDCGLEREADVIGRRAVQAQMGDSAGGHARGVDSGSGGALQGQCMVRGDAVETMTQGRPDDAMRDTARPLQHLATSASGAGPVTQCNNGKSTDPAHRYWELLRQGSLHPTRFLREGGRGIFGYLTSHFMHPPLLPPPEVAADPARLQYHHNLVRLLLQKAGPQFLFQQWLWQNIRQAQGGNPLPVQAGQRMIEGAEQMGRARNTADLLRGHWYAQMQSLGGAGFRGGASYLMHGLSIPWQWPTLITHSLLRGPQSLSQNPVHPMRTMTRMAPRSLPLALVLLLAGAERYRRGGGQ